MKLQTTPYALLALFFLAGCTSLETEVPGIGKEDREIALSIRSLNLSVETKAIYETGKNDLTEFGVLVTKEDAGKKAVYYSTDPTMQTFTLADELWTPDKALKLVKAAGTLYAWAPVDQTDSPGTLTTDETPLPVIQSPTVRSVQTYKYGNEYETDQADYLYGSAAATAGDVTHTTVNRETWEVQTLYMQHALAKVSFRIMKAKGQDLSDEDYVKQIKLSSADKFVVTPTTKKNLTLSLVDGSLTDAGGDATSLSDTITLTATQRGQMAAWTVKVGEEGVQDFSKIAFAQAYGLAVPVTVGQLVIALTLGKDTALDEAADRTYATKPDEQVLRNVKWEKGKHYLYTLTVSDSGLTIASMTVVGWGTALETDVPVEPEKPVVPEPDPTPDPEL